MNTSQHERQELLELYNDLRVADVRDGMDWLMMHHVGSMSPAIRPLFRTRAVGIARTARYFPYPNPIPTMSPDQYSQWVSWYYKNVCQYPWLEQVEPGDFCVIDQSGVDAGLLGSHNTLIGIRAGARGYITNAGVRDTDEIIIQKVPFWSAFVSQKMVQGRLQFDAANVSVNVGGVLVNPGDVVVADGDGVIVVPKAVARDVAQHARQQLASDKAVRRKLYVALGMNLDETVADTP
jgi:4-hydroxy-4-methyl-2-oxoglutarate aldolase